MTEFTKTKITFALALLGTLFALHPFLAAYLDSGFPYLDYDLKLFYAYALTGGLLAASVYFYAVALVSERPSSWLERTGNYTYALAVIVPPLYAGLYLASLLEQRLNESQLGWLARAAPAVALGVGLAWLLLSQLLAWRLRRRMGDQDRVAKASQLAEQEIHALNRAREMFDGGHYDLSVIEAWRAIEARLRRVLLRKHLVTGEESPQAMIDTAVRAGLLGEHARSLLQELRRQWNVAVSTEPLNREAAETAVRAARDILSTIALDEPRKPGTPTL
jgi:HEPN domain-containing protein